MNQCDVSLHHLLYQFLERNFGMPIKSCSSFLRRATQIGNLCWSVEVRVDTNSNLAITSIDTNLVNSTPTPALSVRLASSFSFALRQIHSLQLNPHDLKCGHHKVSDRSCLASR